VTNYSNLTYVVYTSSLLLVKKIESIINKEVKYNMVEKICTNKKLFKTFKKKIVSQDKYGRDLYISLFCQHSYNYFGDTR